jgi:hypothetical protein
VTSQHADARPPRPWPLLVLAAPAFVAIWSGWVGLGEMTGFGDVKPLPGTPLAGLTVHTAITLPIGVETYAAYALGVWLAEVGNARALAFARASAIGSLLLGAGGQVAYHLLKAAGVQRAPWPITTIVSVLPVATLGMGVALAHMLQRPKVDASASDLPVPDHAPAFRLAAGLRLEVERPGHDAPAPFPEARPRGVPRGRRGHGPRPGRGPRGAPGHRRPAGRPARPAPAPAPALGRSSRPGATARPCTSPGHGTPRRGPRPGSRSTSASPRRRRPGRSSTGGVSGRSASAPSVVGRLAGSQPADHARGPRPGSGRGPRRVSPPATGAARPAGLSRPGRVHGSCPQGPTGRSARSVAGRRGAGMPLRVGAARGSRRSRSTRRPVRGASCAASPGYSRPSSWVTQAAAWSGGSCGSGMPPGCRSSERTFEQPLPSGFTRPAGRSSPQRAGPPERPARGSGRPGRSASPGTVP